VRHLQRYRRLRWSAASAANGLEGSSVMQVDKSASGRAFLKALQAATG
jgi:hypothetical protein